MSLRAPIAVPVELRADALRAFRLSWNVGEDGLRLAGRLPFETGRLVEARFSLPGGAALALRAEVTAGGIDRQDDPGEPSCGELSFLEPPGDARKSLHAYVVERLELPG